MTVFVETARPNKDVVRNWNYRGLVTLSKGDAKNVFTLAGPSAECVKAGIQLELIDPAATHVYSIEKVKAVAQRSYQSLCTLVGSTRTHVFHSDVSLWRRDLLRRDYQQLDEVFYDKCGALQFSDMLLFIEQFGGGLISEDSPVTFTFCAPFRLKYHPSVVHNYLEKTVLTEFPGWYHRDSAEHVELVYLGVERSEALDRMVGCHAAYCEMMLSCYTRELSKIVVYKDIKTIMMSFHFICKKAKPAMQEDFWRSRVRKVIAGAMNQILITP